MAPALRMRFEGLEPGEWIVDLANTGHLPSFAPMLPVSVDASVGELELVCLDRAQSMETLALELVEAESGEPIASGSVLLFLDGELSMGRGFMLGQGVVGPIVAGRELDFLVAAIGRRPLFERGVRLPLGEATDGRVARAMEPGWGLLVVARDDTGSPVAGVELELDGVPAGRTDASGRLLLAGDSPGTRVGVRGDAWELAGGDAGGASGLLPAPEPGRIARPLSLVLQRASNRPGSTGD